MSLSLCMIVKNEERFLTDCLESVKDCVDEMILVDTGSSDNTVKIAESFGAKVYHHPWENDFSKHRNQSIGYANGEWILWLDADEALEPGGSDIIRKVLESHSIDSLMVTMVCYFENRTRESWNNTIKIFRNGLGIHFEGAVHNQVVGYKNTQFCPVKIYHFGYDVDQKTVWKKFERTSTLLLKAIEKDPSNFRHHHDLAVSYSSIQRHRAALDEGLEAIKLYGQNKESDPNILWTYFVVATSYYNLGLLDEARAVAEKAVGISPEHFDSYYVLASFYSAQKNRIKFKQIYDKIIRLIKKFTQNPELLEGLIINKIAEKWRLDLEYGKLLLADKKKKEAIKFLHRAINGAPNKSTAYKLASIVCRENAAFELAEQFLQSAIEAGMDSHAVTLEKALAHKAMGRVARYHELLEDLLSSNDLQNPRFISTLAFEALKIGRYQKAESLLMKALADSYGNPKTFNALALSCRYQGKMAEAVQWAEKTLKIEEGDVDALTILGHLYYELKNWGQAKAYYQRGIAIDGQRIDILFRLSLLSLMDQEINVCVELCDLLLANLGISCDMALENIGDLALVYQMIGDAFLKAGEKKLYSEAMQFAQAMQT